MIKLTPVKEPDNDFLRQLFFEMKEEEFQFLPLPLEQRQHLINQQFFIQQQAYTSTFPNHQHVILTYHNQQAGQARINYTDKSLHIIDISVLKMFQKKGIATQCIRLLQQEASRDTRTISLNVFHTNQAARRLYERLGFHVVQDNHSYLMMEWQDSIA